MIYVKSVLYKLLNLTIIVGKERVDQVTYTLPSSHFTDSHFEHTDDASRPLIE